MVEKTHILASAPSPKVESGADLNAERRRQAIVLATCQVLTDKGFEGLRTREVAAQVGLNHATLHYYYPTKEALIEAVVDHVGVVFTELYESREERKAMNPEEDLRFHIGVVVRQIEKTPALFGAMEELRLRARRDETVRNILGRCETGWRTCLLETIIAGQASGHFLPTLDPEVTVELMRCVLMGLCIRRDIDEQTRGRVADTLIDCLTGAGCVSKEP
jgi:AcrR family transcriptional regulator